MADDDSVTATPASEPSVPRDEIDYIRRTRRHPRPIQFDYLHLRYLLEDLTSALSELRGPTRDVLDIYCGVRPYEDLLPPGSRCVGLDIDNRYGTADVVTHEFLPFPDASFDLVICTEAFHFVADPVHGEAEIRRVLRPGGAVVIAVPFVWEYNRTILEHRYTGPELASLFAAWDDVDVVENGGRAVAWATMTGWFLSELEWRTARRLPLRRVLRAGFLTAYLALNGVAVLLDRAERRYLQSQMTLPMNLLMTARRPTDG